MKTTPTLNPQQKTLLVAALNFGKGGPKKFCRTSSATVSTLGLEILELAYSQSGSKSWGDFFVLLAAFWLKNRGSAKP